MKEVRLIGLHAHIGSQAMDLGPYLESVDLFADLYLDIQKKFNLTLPHLDVGGGLGIAYTPADKPLSMQHWARVVSERVKSIIYKPQSSAAGAISGAWSSNRRQCRSDSLQHWPSQATARRHQLFGRRWWHGR
jgi:arginine decarboxylase-like protein